MWVTRLIKVVIILVIVLVVGAIYNALVNGLNSIHWFVRFLIGVLAVVGFIYAIDGRD